MSTEATAVYDYEVYNNKLEPYFQLPRFTTKENAEQVAADLDKKLGINFFVRQVEAGKEPIPPKAAVTSYITVHEARKLMASHGQDVLVCVVWSEKGSVNIVTAGSNRENSQQALGLGDKIAAGLGLQMGEPIEDRREEHST